jgi:hypothetical protein
MDTGELLTRWTVRVAVILYVVSLASRRHLPTISRFSWTAGCLAYLLHVLAAFHYYHQWSHDAAYESTQRQTAEIAGLDWGGGLYVNYAFTLVWLLDVIWWWLAPERYLKRPRWIDWGVQLFLGFVVFNATVVFASGFSRWFGIGACGVLAVEWAWPRKERAGVDEDHQRRASLDGGDHR